MIGLLALTLGALASGCGSRGSVTVPHGEDVDDGLASARAARVHVYYAGRSLAGLPLTGVDVEGPDRVLIVYGTCRIALPADGGCAPPIQIQHFPFKPADWRLAINCHRRPSLLGVPTVRHDGLVLFTEGQVVKIYARSPAEDRRVARALRRVSDDTPVRHLPAPDPRVAELQADVCR
jgi:hypothetical protein